MLYTNAIRKIFISREISATLDNVIKQAKEAGYAICAFECTIYVYDTVNNQ